MANVLVGHRVVRTFQVEVGNAVSFDVEAGQLVQIVDMAGKQVAGFLAYGGDDRAERLSTTTTMTANASIVLKTGDTLYGENRTAMFEVVDDTVGRHDLITGSLPTPAQAEASSSTVQPTIRDAVVDAASDAGVPGGDVSDAVNWFKHVVIKQRGELEVKESFSERGDMVILRALVDALAIVSNNYHERRPGVTAGKTAAEKQGKLQVRVYA
ncbi:MAG TPA: urea carboxylase-associated family protein [Thermomicrobiales bacterium]|nr:urea carboxylase-associated family protein [Thermomicrobiales bacterium]